MNKNPQNLNLSNLGPYEEAKHAFESLQARMATLAAESLQPIKVDIGRAAMIVIAAEPRIRALLPEMKRLPDFSVEHVRDLRDLALAAWYAHTSYRRADDQTEVTHLGADALVLRQSLKRQAQAFAALGLLNAQDLATIRGSTGHWDVARNLVQLVQLLDRAPPPITVDRTELERAANTAAQLTLALGSREARRQGKIEKPEGAIARARALTLLATSYSEVRRAVTYLRWREGDADTIAPSLYVGRPRRRASDPNAPPPPPPLV
jgi:hypothetical protein